MKEVIMKLTSDYIKVKGGEYVRDVVRCKDCIVFGTHGKNTDICPMWHNTRIDPYRDFCSRGERREP